MAKPEFQAVVLAAGRGNRISDLVGDRPKCLLPVGPFPMIYYPLNMLEKHGFEEIIIIVLESQRSEIQQSIERTPIKAKLEFATLPSDSDFGTADAIYHIQDRITCDLVVVSCDTITNMNLFTMLDHFRQNNASLLTQLFMNEFEDDAVVPGPKKKHRAERDIIAVHPATRRLSFMASTSDYDECVELQSHLVRRYGLIIMNSRWLDSHIYIMKRWIVDFGFGNKHIFSTIKGELIPYIVKKQQSKPRQHPNEVDKALSFVHLNMKTNDIFNFITQTDLERKITETGIYNDSCNHNPYSGDLIRCFALNPQDDCFGIRVNTIPAYCAINQKIFGLWGQLFPLDAPPLVSPQSNVKSTQMNECAVSDNTTITEKTSLKNCILGSNVTVNMKTRISNSILMNGVVIEEGVVIENCVICDKAIIRKGSVLKNCLIGPGHEVAENTNKEKAHLTNSDGFMEIE